MKNVLMSCIVFGITNAVIPASAQLTNAPPTLAEPLLRVPTVDYRKEWVQLGQFSVLAAKPQDGAKEIHTTFTERKNVDAFLKDGKFPDGTIIVKDVWGTKTEALTTGTVSYSGVLEGRFVMVKDAAGKLGKGPRFGDGWGWAFYKGDERSMTITDNYKTNCIACHEPARETGLLYTRGYPVLRKK